MREDDFNLISEPWIRVRTIDAEVEEVSLLDVFRRAHELRALAGELPTQDAAVLRLLLAVLYTVFSRVDAEGEDSPVADEDDCLDRWQELWEKEKLPFEPIEAYLHSVEDRFWLFDPEQPFFQVPGVKRVGGTASGGKEKEPISVEKLNGEISKSGNKLRLFSSRAGEEKDSLTYAAAARWLVHIVAYDDCAIKKSDEFKQREKKLGVKEKESPGTGWLGKLGLVYAEGANLFETLMLNLAVPEERQSWDEINEKPLWEQGAQGIHEREAVGLPDNMAELLTFPSRQIYLCRENGMVTGYYGIYGKYFSAAAPMEQMTLRRGISKNADDSPYMPKKHAEESFLWQEFESLFVQSENTGDRRPGVVRWISRIQAPDFAMLAADKSVCFRSTGIFYGAQSCSVQQIESDGLTLHANLVSELGEQWRFLIREEIAFAQRIAWRVGDLAGDICLASGGDPDDTGVKNITIAQFYEEMDIPFRRWLASISADDQDKEGKRKEWRELVRRSALRLGKDLAENASPAAFVGRMVKLDKKTEQFYTAAKAYNRFCYWVKNLE